MKKFLPIISLIATIATNAQNVGIGTPTPLKRLHIMDGSVSTGITPNSDASVVIERKTGNSYLNILTDTNRASGIAFGNQYSSVDAGIYYNVGFNSYDMRFRTNGNTTRMIIDSIGRVGIGGGAPAQSAALDVSSFNRGVLFPRMNSSTRKSIANPAPGLFCFDTDKRCFYYYDGSDWIALMAQPKDFVPMIRRTVDTTDQEDLHTGSEVAIDGEYAATSATQYDVDGVLDNGCVFIFKKNQGAWNYVQQILPDNFQASGGFGGTIAISGDLLVVASPSWDAGVKFNQGKIWYYKRNGTTFDFLDTLSLGTGGDAGDQFGSSIALDGNMLVVGVSGYDAGTVTNRGAVYTYEFNTTTNKFVFKQRLDPPNGKSGDQTGYCVAIDGDYMVAGSINHKSGAETKGCLYVWVYGGSTWTFQDSINVTETSKFRRMGVHVAISGDYIATGGNYLESESLGLDQGTAMIYKRSGNQWVFSQDIRSDDTRNDNASPMVSMRNTYLVIGNSLEDMYEQKGNVYLYVQGSGVYSKVRRFNNYLNDAIYATFPSAIATDANYIMIGQPDFDNNKGGVYFTTMKD